MRNKLDNLLLGLLWILVSLLGLCFWFNIQFGFNLLSSSHWQHLSYMQATRTPITPLFYISLVIGVLFIFVGLYMVIRPKFRKIKLPTPQPDTQTHTHNISTCRGGEVFAIYRWYIRTAVRLVTVSEMDRRKFAALLYSILYNIKEEK